MSTKKFIQEKFVQPADTIKKVTERKSKPKTKVVK
jgi:hypothetical protein